MSQKYLTNVFQISVAAVYCLRCVVFCAEIASVFHRLMLLNLEWKQFH